MALTDAQKAKLLEAREKSQDPSASESEREKARAASRPPDGWAWQTDVTGTRLVNLVEE